jgi:hypothetical protein
MAYLIGKFGERNLAQASYLILAFPWGLTCKKSMLTYILNQVATLTEQIPPSTRKVSGLQDKLISKLCYKVHFVCSLSNVILIHDAAYVIMSISHLLHPS